MAGNKTRLAEQRQLAIKVDESLIGRRAARAAVAWFPRDWALKTDQALC